MNKRFNLPKLTVHSLAVGPLQMNASVLMCNATKKGAIVDGGGNISGLLNIAKDLDAEIEKILQTHAHIDHVAGLSELKKKTKAPIYLHPADLPIYNNAPAHGVKYGFNIGPLPPVDYDLEEGQIINVGNCSAEVLFLPGHSPGSVIFFFKEEKVAIAGDVLFAGSIGRVDLPLSDPDAMRKSIARVKLLPPDTLIIPGHGPETTIEMELKRNPFLTQDW